MKDRTRQVFQHLKEGKTLVEIGVLFGVSKQRVEQLIRPEKFAARKKLHKAVKRGAVTPRFCEYPKCDYEKFGHAHHYDYSDPYDVIWLCPKHHKALHQEMSTWGQL